MSADEAIVVVDDRAGFYMVPTTAITKARGRLSGAHLTEALAGLACLARAAFAQHGASRDEPQTLEANLDELATRILGVSRARALRIVDNLAEAGAVTKEAHRFDGTRRLPTRITFTDLAYSFAYISGPAFRALRTHNNDAVPLGSLALYVTLVALAGEQRSQFPEGNRRVVRASQPDLAKLSGLSVSSVKRAIATLTAARLLTERLQPAHTLKTTTVYHLIDPADTATTTATAAQSQPDRSPAHSPTGDSSPSDRPPVHAQTAAEPQPDRRTAHRTTDDSSPPERPPAPGPTDGQPDERPRAHVNDSQRTPEDQNPDLPHLADRSAGGSGGGGKFVTEADELVDVFCGWTRQALGERRAAALYDPDSWRQIAVQLLEQYDLDRLLAGIERLSRDALLADKATTLPEFARIADRAIARAAADRAMATHRAGSGATSPNAAPSWASTQGLLRQAVSAFGGGGEDRALAFLEDKQPLIAAFARQVGWRALARSDDHMTDIKFAYLTYCKHDTAEAA